MNQTPARKFRILAQQTNRQYAHAVVYGDMSREEASTFGVWVLRHKLNHSSPADNLALYLDAES